MTIEQAAPPRILRRSYDRIVATVVAAGGKWARFRMDEFSGSSNQTKQAQVIRAGYSRGRSFQTRTTGDGFMEVRVREGDSARD